MKQATLFPLSAVRLLPGVLKDRQETDRRYLVEVLDPEQNTTFHDNFLDSGGHYLSALAACHAATGDRRALERAERFVAGIGRCQQKHGDGYAGAVDKSCFEKLRRGEIVAHGFALNGIWVPLYNLHKLLAGLRDAYRLCGIAAALEIARKQAEYLLAVWEKLNDAQLQEILKCEHGGIAETLISLSADTGDRRNPRSTRCAPDATSWTGCTATL